MCQDEIVKEIRKIREAYAAKFKYDVGAICRDLRERQARWGGKTVSLSSKHPARPQPPMRDRLAKASR